MSYQATDPCTACNEKYEDRCFHHIYTRKAYPHLSEATWNKIPLCKICHTKWHSYGTRTMATKPGVHTWLEDKGWKYDHWAAKWYHPQKTEN